MYMYACVCMHYVTIVCTFRIISPWLMAHFSFSNMPSNLIMLLSLEPVLPDRTLCLIGLHEVYFFHLFTSHISVSLCLVSYKRHMIYFLIHSDNFYILIGVISFHLLSLLTCSILIYYLTINSSLSCLFYVPFLFFMYPFVFSAFHFSSFLLYLLVIICLKKPFSHQLL